MPRSAKSVPSYLHHKPTDQAYVRVPDGKGGRRVIYLGRHGSPESYAEYLRLHNQHPRPFAWTKNADVILSKVRNLAERLAPDQPETNF